MNSRAIAVVAAAARPPGGGDLGVLGEPRAAEPLDHGERAHQAIVAGGRQPLAEPDEPERALEELGRVAAREAIGEA